MMGSTRYTLTEADVVDAQKAWWTGAANWRAWLRTTGWLTLVYGVYMIWVAKTSDQPWWGYLEFLGGAVLAAAALALLLFALGLISSPMRARRAFRQHKALAGEYETQWDDDGIHFTNERSSSRLSWPILHKWLEGPKTLLFYQTNGLYIPVPKDALKPDQVVEIIRLMRAAGVPEAKRFGIFSSK